MQLIYCDESCHLPNDKINSMVLGAVYCNEKYKREIFNDIRIIKEKHNLSPYFEIKWTKVSIGKIEFYLELLDYFFKKESLNFRGLVAKGKNSLNHEEYNDGDYDTWYYKMYYYLLNYILNLNENHRIFIDIKDTNGGDRTNELHNILCNYMHDKNREIIHDIRQIHSCESEILQLTDLIIGAISYYQRGLNTINPNGGKSLIVNRLKELSGSSLNEKNQSLKFNLFIWTPRK
ncbi:DUF3800 domain-containing protein [uncultured Ilyobacter sp.]|uniref:DUF3800 domain-containing protein n=1 Tax=uncultured Ilyobacter sp. TaxID=544433 RepID=UPI0029C752B6|nr:DUF3800 domain-containing protein [uncultured Ilyobacter sp.]